MWGLRLIPFVIVFIFNGGQLGNCDSTEQGNLEHWDMVDPNREPEPESDPILELADSLSIARDWALHFDEELGRTDEEGVISEHKRVEIENNLIDVAELLHILPPHQTPRKIYDEWNLISTSPPTSTTSSYSLRGYRPTTNKMVTQGKLSVPLEPTFSLSLGYTTSKPKVVGLVTIPESESESIPRKHHDGIVLVSPSRPKPTSSNVQLKYSTVSLRRQRNYKRLS